MKAKKRLGRSEALDACRDYSERKMFESIPPKSFSLSLFVLAISVQMQASAFAQDLDRIDKFVGSLDEVLSKSDVNGDGTNIFPAFESICRSASEKELEKIITLSRKDARLRLIVFASFPSPFLAHDFQPQPYTRTQAPVILRIMRTQLQANPAFLGDYIQFFRWTDGMRIPDFRDNWTRSPDFDAKLDIEVFANRLAKLREAASKDLDDANIIQLLCYGDVLSTKLTGADPQAAIRTAMRSLRAGKYTRDKACSRYVLQGESDTAAEREKNGKPRLLLLRRPTLPFKNMPEEAQKFLEVYSSDIWMLSEYRSNF